MFRWIAKIWNAATSTFQRPAQWLISAMGGGSIADSGVKVTSETALGWAPVWYAVSRIAGHVSMLPITPMRRLPAGGAEKDKSHSTYRLVRTRPNATISAAVFWELLMAHALLFGNGKAGVIRARGRVREIIPIHPLQSVTCFVDGEKWHAVRIDGNEDDPLVSQGGTENTVNDGTRWLKIPDRDVLHIPGLGLDGAVGLCTYKVSMDTWGIGLGAEKAASADFKNGSKMSVMLQAPEGMFEDEKEAKQFVENFNKFHAGLDNRGKAGLLWGGVTATTLTGSNVEADWVAQRKFQRQDVALLFGLESIIGDDKNSSYKSGEQSDIAYLKNTLAKWLRKIEQECDEKLLTTRQKASDTHFFKFNTAALLRTDFKTTMEAFGIAITHRIMNPNECRERLDMNPYDGGDEYENPAITPGSPDSSDSGASEPDPPEDSNRKAIVSHLKHLIEVESKRVLSAAGNKRNYMGWLEHFYGTWESTLGNAIIEYGGTGDLATTHCASSLAELVEIAGTVPIDELADAVAETVSDWPARAETLAESIGAVACSS